MRRRLDGERWPLMWCMRISKWWLSRRKLIQHHLPLPSSFSGDEKSLTFGLQVDQENVLRGGDQRPRVCGHLHPAGPREASCLCLSQRDGGDITLGATDCFHMRPSLSGERIGILAAYWQRHQRGTDDKPERGFQSDQQTIWSLQKAGGAEGGKQKELYREGGELGIAINKS